MTYATMNRNFNQDRSPLLGIAAVVAAAVTLSIAVLLPAQLAPTAVRGYAQAAAATPAATPIPTFAVEAPVDVVTLPPIEVTATRPTKAAAIRPWNVPAVYKQKS